MKSWWLGVQQLLGERLSALAELTQPLMQGWRWIIVALLIGFVPFATTWLLQLPGQQVVSAFCLSLALLPMVARDRFLAGPALLALTFAAHCATAVGFTHYDPSRTAPLMPDAAAYWEKQHHWITTGEDPEYELSEWVPAHLQLAVGATLFSATSLGWLTFMQGFYEVDLMNYYLGQLMRHTDQPQIAAGTGWHIWSILRGIGFVFLTFETVSLSYAWIVNLTTASIRQRIARWSLGLGFLLADGIVKLLFLETVRQQLEALLPS